MCHSNGCDRPHRDAASHAVRAKIVVGSREPRPLWKRIVVINRCRHSLVTSAEPAANFELAHVSLRSCEGPSAAARGRSVSVVAPRAEVRADRGPFTHLPGAHMGAPTAERSIPDLPESVSRRVLGAA